MSLLKIMKMEMKMRVLIKKSSLCLEKINMLVKELQNKHGWHKKIQKLWEIQKRLLKLSECSWTIKSCCTFAAYKEKVTEHILDSLRVRTANPYVNSTNINTRRSSLFYFIAYNCIYFVKLQLPCILTLYVNIYVCTYRQIKLNSQRG